MFDEKFWLAIAFFTFVFLVIKYVSPIITKQLELKARQISEDLIDAKEMRKRAAKILADSEIKYKEAVEFADKLIKDSAIEAQKYLADSYKAIDLEIAKKVAAIDSRIKQEEEIAVREIKVKIINSAIQVVQNNLQNAQKLQSDNLIKKAVADFSKIIH